MVQSRNDTTTALRQPTFLYIGTGKSGSSWIFEILREHPEVFVPVAKDLRFFETEFYDPDQFERYLRHFQKGESFAAVGELSHNYILSEQCAMHIQHHLPDVKLLVCLREPGNWVLAAYRYARLFRREAEAGFDQYYSQLLTQRGVLNFYRNLRAYYDRFPQDHIRVMFYEDLKRDSAAFARSIYDFVGVDPDFQPPALHTIVNAGRSSRFGNRVTQFLNSTAQTMRHLHLETLLGYLKQSQVVNQLLFNNDPEQVESLEQEIARIRRDCAVDYPRLEELIGRSLPDEWYARLPADETP